MNRKSTDISALINHFSKVVGKSFIPKAEYMIQAQRLFDNCRDYIYREDKREALCMSAINQKFDFNKDSVKTLIDFAASRKVYFNFQEKKDIRNFFDSSDKVGFEKWIRSKFKDKNEQKLYRDLYIPLGKESTIEKLHDAIRTSNKEGEILHSLFSAYIFNSFEIKYVHQYFSGIETAKEADYIDNYYEYLHKSLGGRLKRSQALSFLIITDSLIRSCKNVEELKDSLCRYIKKAYSNLSNHCYLAVYLETDKQLQWELYSDIVLFAEKFIEEELKIGYFHPEKIKEQTKKHIPELMEEEANFKIANGGFTYKDCFILAEKDIKNSSDNEFHGNYNLLLLFEKNERDETIIPCPACRSNNVRGNSYPVIGVKSWECNNILCPDRSKSDRGKRYSYSSLIKQEAIFNEANEIPNGAIKRWQLDVLAETAKEKILEFLIEHYTLVNDTVEVTGYDFKENNFSDRKIITSAFEQINDGSLSGFYGSCFFKKFAIRKQSSSPDRFANISPYKSCEIYNGDSSEVLRGMNDNSIDAAITSPPYYNAKEYSQWDNIYCYLYDMYNNACEVYRVLKPGAIYLYNIFDYFDNENNIVFSAMGKKRMILGAYIIYLLKLAGFKLIGNTIWYKGHVQGNRSFNQGNTFPYYQSPLNCYEHVFQFVKPADKENSEFRFPTISYIKPVNKMINGENILGHSAPFPHGVPNLLLRQMSSDEIVLDPYAGSFTTARAAIPFNIKSINIELDDKYCDLGIGLIKKACHT